MKLAWIIFGSIMSLLFAFAIWQNKNIRDENISSDFPQDYTRYSIPENANSGKSSTVQYKKKATSLLSANGEPPYTGTLPRQILPDSIVAYGIKLIGVPYVAAGITCEGFDCSGFIHHIYNKYGINLPHSSAMLADKGEPVNLQEVKKGDLLIFTGTTVSDRTPGHVGVVITNPGEPIEFVHASSEGGVKISKVAGTGYEKRFLQARRVL